MSDICRILKCGRNVLTSLFAAFGFCFFVCLVGFGVFFLFVCFILWQGQKALKFVVGKKNQPICIKVHYLPIYKNTFKSFAIIFHSVFTDL